MKYWKIIGIVLILAAAIYIFATLESSCPPGPVVLPPIANENLAANVNAANSNLANANANLKLLENAANEAANEVNKLQENTNNARNTTNNSLGNLNAVHNMDFNRTNRNAAERARCRAKPSAPECQ